MLWAREGALALLEPPSPGWPAGSVSVVLPACLQRLGPATGQLIISVTVGGGSTVPGGSSPVSLGRAAK